MGEIQLKAPLTINWAVNNNCNFACRHCYSRNDAMKEIDCSMLCHCLEKVATAGVMSVNFGGGEPLLRQDLATIASCAAQSGMRVSMNSNGYLIDRKKALELKEAGFSKVGISIDSHVPAIHDDFRGVSGSHGRAVNALAYLQEAGIKTSISTVICKLNHRDVAPLIDLAEKLHVEQLNFHNFKCSGLGYSNRDDLDLTPEEWQSFYAEAIMEKQRGRKLDISLDDPIIASLGMHDTNNMVKGSVCGKLSLNIKSNGDITPCGFIPVVIGNILADDLQELWKSSSVLEKLRNKVATGKCVGCSDYNECLGGCSARALALTGDFNSPDPHCWQP
ncbi:GeoRSP system radical SAM/SPASM protein [Geotalea toluenoxydans]